MQFVFEDFDAKQVRAYLDVVAALENKYIKENKASFEGVPAALQKLKKDGYLLGVCSNASLRYISMVLTELGFIDLIDCIQNILPGLAKMDTLQMLLQKVEPDAAVMVGDRHYDMEAAIYNHIPFIGCLYGYAPDEIKNADICINNGEELYKAVHTLLPLQK